MSNYVVETRTGRGRCFVAARDFSVGEEVLSESAFAMVVAEPFVDVCCGWCGKLCVNETVYNISSDDKVKYCSEHCITADYPVHQHELKPLKLVRTLPTEAISFESARLILRIAVQRTVQLQQADRAQHSEIRNGRENTFESIMTMDHAGAVDSIDSDSSSRAVIEKLEKIGKINKLVINSDEIEHLRDILRCNAHRLFDADGQVLGLGLFPLTSMLNHDCVGNCAHLFAFRPNQPPVLRIVATKAISQGQEVCYSYVPAYQSTALRRHLLQATYNFHCNCARCSRSDLAATTLNRRALYSKASVAEKVAVFSAAYTGVADDSLLDFESDVALDALQALLHNKAAQTEQQATVALLAYFAADGPDTDAMRVLNPCCAAMLQAYSSLLLRLSSASAADESNLRMSLFFGSLALGCIAKFVGPEHSVEGTRLRLKLAHACTALAHLQRSGSTTGSKTRITPFEQVLAELQRGGGDTYLLAETQLSTMVVDLLRCFVLTVVSFDWTVDAVLSHGQLLQHFASELQRGVATFATAIES